MDNTKDNLKRLFTGRFLLILLLAILAQILLGVFAPDSKGYAYDYYSRAILVIVNEGRLPNHTDCWICYHPPLFPIVGAAIFKVVAFFGGGIEAQQYAVSALTSILALVMSVYGFLLYQLYRKHAQLDLIIWALLLFLPVRFISSFSVEADVFAAAFIVISTYYFARYLRAEGVKALLCSAACLSVALLAKYNGMVALLLFGLVLLGRFIYRRDWQRFKHGFLFALVVFIMGGAHYASNLIKYQHPFPGNAAWNTGARYFDYYDFKGFGIGRIVQAFYTEPPRGRTGELRHYSAFNKQVITSHYGQLWTDFSFFTVPDRHGMHEFRVVFRGKTMPIPLVWMILLAGLIPVIYSLIGFVAMLWQREALLMTGLFVITIATYVNWFTGYHIWMLKTKYLLYLIPIWLLYISKCADFIGPRVVALTISPAVVLSVVYCFVFALG